MNLSKHISFSKDVIETPNLVGEFSVADRECIARHIHEGYEKDEASREPWLKRSAAAMDLAMQVADKKTFPWPGCSNVVFPLITIGALQFSARAYQAIIQGPNVVRYRTIGSSDELGLERAKRIGRHMSWQVLEEDESWEEQHDRLLINLAVVGSAFKKTYWDNQMSCPVGRLVVARDLIMDYYAESVECCARKTHRYSMYKNDMYERMARDVFVDCTSESWFERPTGNTASNYGQAHSDRRQGAVPPQNDELTPFYLLEQHTWLDLDGDGYREPYIATVEEQSKTLLRLTARVDDEGQVERKRNGKIICIKPTEYFTKYSFIPAPDGGIYDLGFGVFLGPINEAVDTAINQLLDSGTFQNSIGGFLGRGAKIRGGVYTMAPWEWKRVDSTGDDLKKSLVPFPDRQPSDVLFKLVGLLIDYANRIAGTTDTQVGENPGQNTPASTFQGMQEQGLQTYGMIFKRVWRSMKQEFGLRYDVNKHSLPMVRKFGQDEDIIRREDYTGPSDQIAPVANPRWSTAQQRIDQIMLVKQDAMATQGYDIVEVTKDFLEAIEYPDIPRVYPGPKNVPPDHAPQNPKLQVEMGKIDIAGKKLQVEQQKWANHLLEEKRLNNAKIMLLEAQAAQAVAQTNADQAASKLEALDKELQVYTQYGKMIDSRIAALSGEGGEDGQSTDGGGVSGSDGKSGNESDQSVSVNVPGGSDVTVGQGNVSGGGPGGNSSR